MSGTCKKELAHHFIASKLDITTFLRGQLRSIAPSIYTQYTVYYSTEYRVHQLQLRTVSSSRH